MEVGHRVPQHGLWRLIQRRPFELLYKIRTGDFPLSNAKKEKNVASGLMLLEHPDSRFKNCSTKNIFIDNNIYISLIFYFFFYRH
jgi:hypothetical protein